VKRRRQGNEYEKEVGRCSVKECKESGKTIIIKLRVGTRKGRIRERSRG
jgi:hypothetical protein